MNYPNNNKIQPNSYKIIVNHKCINYQLKNNKNINNYNNK